MKWNITFKSSLLIPLLGCISNTASKENVMRPTWKPSLPMSSWSTKFITKSSCFLKCSIVWLTDESNTNNMSVGKGSQVFSPENKIYVLSNLSYWWRTNLITQINTLSLFCFSFVFKILSFDTENFCLTYVYTSHLL